MLSLLLSTALACSSAAAVPQDPARSAAVAVRGDAELSPAAALASARSKVRDHVRSLWLDRANAEVAAQRPFWLPQALADEALRRWLAQLPVDRLAATVDREDREREHEFGTSYQTTLWVAQDGRAVQRSEQELRRTLRHLERSAVMRLGGVAAGWTGLIVVLAWLDRLSRGYMTGRLRCAGLVAGLAIPALAFLL